MDKSASYKIPLEKEKLLRKLLEKLGLEIKDIENGIFRANNRNFTVTLYKTGTLLIQGKNHSDFIQELISAKIIIEPLKTNPSTFKKPSQKEQGILPKAQHLKEWIGTDESGKGDYFGPLVIAGVMVKRQDVDTLLALGVKDSKKLSDQKIENLSFSIKDLCAYSVVTINPEKYNELMEKIKNLNNLLAWGHARVIENILEKFHCEYVISDQFGNENLIKNALMKKGQTITLHQQHRAEEDVAVACASILARNEFVKKLRTLGSQYKIPLPKGASNEIILIGKSFVKKYGCEKLGFVAKLHFKTTKEII